MLFAPVSTEAKIAVAERAGDRDVPDMRQGAGSAIERRRIGLEHRERARDFASLMIEPFLLVMFRRPPARLVYSEDRRIENPVAQRLEP